MRFHSVYLIILLTIFPLLLFTIYFISYIQNEFYENLPQLDGEFIEIIETFDDSLNITHENVFFIHTNYEIIHELNETQLCSVESAGEFKFILRQLKTGGYSCENIEQKKNFYHKK